jgi:protein-L-isoaspartate(D-aspartate) O-methyltransferase
MNTQQARFNMVEQQIRTWQVLNPKILETLKFVDRELFAPSAYHTLAYSDTEIPAGEGEIMLSPKIQARLVQDLDLKGHECVLQVGCGSGYMSALLSHHCARLLALEINPRLAQLAQSNLAQLGMGNVQIKHLDASKYLETEEFFDVIVLCGSTAHAPQVMLDHLKLGGHLVGIFGSEPIMQTTLVKKVASNQYDAKILWDCIAPRLHGFTEDSKFSF